MRYVMYFTGDPEEAKALARDIRAVDRSSVTLVDAKHFTGEIEQVDEVLIIPGVPTEMADRIAAAYEAAGKDITDIKFREKAGENKEEPEPPPTATEGKEAQAKGTDGEASSAPKTPSPQPPRTTKQR